MDDDERELFTATVREAVRSAAGRDLDPVIDALGWTDALAFDRSAAIGSLFEAAGQTNSRSSATSRVLAAALGCEDLPTTAWVLPPLGRSAPPGSLQDGSIAVHGISFDKVEATSSASVVVSAGARWLAATVPAEALTTRRIEGLDPDLELFEVSGYVPLPATSVEVDWEEGLRQLRLAISHELVGAACGMLDAARAHACDRVQFGKPIAAFQAVRHRLAEAYVAVETARAALEAGWREPTQLTAAMAKIIAGRAARAAGKHGQQVLAGVGFTVEHPFHRYLFRSMVLDKVAGDARSLTAEVGRDLLDRRTAGEFLPL